MTDRIYRSVKQEIFEFKLMPSQYFTESETAERMNASRTPVREALARLQSEGFVEVRFRSGWQVKPFDFDIFDELYDVRITLELAALRKFDKAAMARFLEDLAPVWLVPVKSRIKEDSTIFALDEQFHQRLVQTCGNGEMTRIYGDITERIRIVRKLDFTKADRVAATYLEHGVILELIAEGDIDSASANLVEHIERSKAAVRQITFQMLGEARIRS